jgi:hypothetical protein
LRSIHETIVADKKKSIAYFCARARWVCVLVCMCVCVCVVCVCVCVSVCAPVGECVCLCAHVLVWECVLLLCACVCVALLVWHATRRYVAICDILPPPDISTLSHERYDFRGKNADHKMSVVILYTNFIWNISHSTKNLAKYCHKFKKSSRKVSVIIGGI